MAGKLPGGIGAGLHWAWVPFWGFIFGCATIISLLVIWLAQGHPRDKNNEATVVYISDVGADNHALFIVLGTLTAVFFFVSIFLDYRLRHTERIPVRVRRYERASAAISVIFAFICAVACILLTIFDAFAHETLHWTFSGIFFIALLISGLFNMIELGGKAWHSHHFPSTFTAHMAKTSRHFELIQVLSCLFTAACLAQCVRKASCSAVLTKHAIRRSSVSCIALLSYMLCLGDNSAMSRPFHTHQAHYSSMHAWCKVWFAYMRCVRSGAKTLLLLMQG